MPPDMSGMPLSLLHNGIALTSALAGALAAVWMGVSHRRLCALISFAAGTLLATTFFAIIPEAYSKIPLVPFALALASGYTLFALLSRFVFHVCPACAASHFDEHAAASFKSFALLLGIAFGIHSAMDGLALALAPQAAPTTDLSVLLTVTLHKFPEGLALAALLVNAGFPKARAVALTLAFESTTLAGWITGMVLGIHPDSSAWFYGILLHVGGGFVFLALHALLNESKKHPPLFMGIFFLAGFLLILASRWLPVHAH
jgi:zinc and cadmium transporter